MSYLTMETIREAMRLLETIQKNPLPNMRIFPNVNLMERFQFRFPRSKGRRIRTKWSKQGRNWSTRPDTHVYMTPDGIYCHPVIASAIQNTIPAALDRMEPGLGQFAKGMMGFYLGG